MGIGTLRRYHEDSRVAGLTPAPQGSEDEPQEQIDARTEEEQRQEAAEAGKVREFEAKLALNAAVAEFEEVERAREERDSRENAKAILAAAQAVVEADEAVAAAIAEDDADRQRVAEEAQRKADEEAEAQANAAAKADAAANPAGAPEGANADGTAPPQDTKHGEYERPAATGSTDAWVKYAQADPNGSRVADLTPRSGLRDEIAQAYLGK